MSFIVEVDFYNSYIIQKAITKSSLGPDEGPGWPGPYFPGPLTFATNELPQSWFVEEGRIRGGFNNVSTDQGVRAYLDEQYPLQQNRISTLIYSGIYNSRTGINQTNVFSVADAITKSLDPVYGSIQKTYAEETNLIVFQENRIHRALIDKDTIYTAEGGGAVTNANVVIGTIQPIPGKYGISQNPESFAYYGYNKYFSDKNNNVILKLQGANIVEISQLGMRDYFRDELNSLTLGGAQGKAIGGYDIYNDQYVISTQQNNVGQSQIVYNTVTYDESVQGWTSFFDYRPDQIFSIKNNMYTTDGTGLYKHYSTEVNRGQFYGTDFPSTITVVFNPEPLRSKTFSTVSYEGSNGWEVTSLESDNTGIQIDGNNQTYGNNADSILPVLSYYEGEYVINPTGGAVVPRASYNATLGTYDPGLPRYYAGFNRKENYYVANIVNNSRAMSGEIIYGNQISGVKGYYTTATFSTDSTTDAGGVKALFSVGAKFETNNGY